MNLLEIPPTKTACPPKIRWISTKTIVADGLIKAMKAEQFDPLIKTGQRNVEFQSPLLKEHGCENEGNTMIIT